MSYLLDALKKAEQERKQGEQSELPLYTEPEVRATLPMWLVVLVVAVLGATVLKLFAGGDGAGNAKVEEQASISEEVSLDQHQSIGTNNPNEVFVEQNDVSEMEAPVTAATKELSELDAITLSKIPSLSLESHIYSQAAEYRSVVINGQSYNEGALLAAGVVLSEISQTGIVIKVGEQYVVLPKGISWVSTKHAK